MDRRARRILWLDGGAGCAAGVSVLLLRHWLSELHGFSLSLVAFLGLANLGYAAYSGSLAARASFGKAPSRLAIDVLIAANLAWVGVCALLLASTSPTAFGVAHVTFEGVFVGGLAVAEYRFVRPYL